MYVYINSQGRVLETITAEQVNQGSDFANRIHFHVEGLTRAQNPTVTAQFRLPDGTTVAKPISANVEDPGYVPESDFDYRVFKPDYPYLFWYCDLDSTLLEQTGTLFCSLIVQINGQTVMTTVQGMITIAVKESAVDDPNLSLSQYEYLLYWIGDQTAGKYVLKVGDTMTGPLSTPKITVDEIDSDEETIALDKPIHFGSEIYSYSELGETGLTVRGATGQSSVLPTEISTSAGSSYIKFSFSGSNPIIETVNNGGSAIRSYMPTKSGFLGVLGDDVASAYLGYRSEDGHLFLEITKQDGSTINSDVDLPLESAIVGMTYDHDTQTITFTLTSGASVSVPVSDIFQGVVTLDNGGWARENQMSVSVVYDNLTNINGKALTSFASEPYDDGTYQGYYILTAGDEAFLTKEQASVYMKAMTGSDYVPEYDYDHPTNSYFIFSDKTLWKPQWSETTGLVLYSMRTTMVDAESAQTITGKKTITNKLEFKNDNSNILNQIYTDNYGGMIFARNNSEVFGYGGSDVRLYDKHLLPRVGNSSWDIGNSTSLWHDLYLNGKAIFGNSTNFVQFSSGTGKLYSNIGILVNGDVQLQNGNITDGTNSMSVADIKQIQTQLANLIKINALAVAEESDIWDLPMTVPSIVYNGAVIDGSKMRLGALYGKCVAWNQMVDPTRTTYTENGITVTNNGDGSFTINGTATANVNVSFNMNSWGKIQFVAGHKCLMKGNQSTSNPLMLCAGHSDAGAGAIWTNADTESNKSVYTLIASGTTVSNIKYRPQIFDLTLIYGAGNEPTTVAQFEADFPEAYYAYDAGSIKGSAMTKITSHSRNLLDNANNLTVGDYVATTGQGAESAGSFRCINSIPCKPSTAYYLKAFNFENGDGGRATYMYFWDADGNFINSTANYSKAIALGFTTPANARKMAMQIYTAGRNYRGQVPLDGQFMLVEGSVAPTQYEPYFEDELTIPTAVRDFAKYGVNGVCNELDIKNQGAITRLGEVDLGSLNWTKTSQSRFTTSGLQSLVKKPATDATEANLLCTKFLTSTAGKVYSHDATNIVALSSYGHLYVYVDDTYYSYTSEAQFKTAMNGVKLVYELAEESATDLSAIGDLGDFSPYLNIKIGGKVDSDSEVKPTIDASFAVYE